MTDDVFRIIVTAGVAVVAIAFVIQAIIVIAFYKAFRKMQEKAESFAASAAPVIEKAGPMVERFRLLGEQAGPVVEKAGRLIEKAVPAVEKAGPVFDRAVPLIDKAAGLLDSANRIAVSTQQILEDARPRISAISTDVAGIAKTGREQVERVGEFVSEATGRARARVDQIDRTLDHTIENVEHAGTAVKQKVLRPVRGAGGFAAGVFAALSVLVRGRKHSVDSATQDEEMFI